MSYIEKLYSEAFDEGFEYAIEKLYSLAEERKLLDQLKGMGYSGKRLDNYLRDWKNERRYVADRFKRGDKGSLEFQKLKLSSGKTFEDDPVYSRYTRWDSSGDPTKIKKAITEDILSDAR